VADAIGAELVSKRQLRKSDIPLRWEGRVVGGMRLPPLDRALDGMIAGLEQDFGAPLHKLDREQKQLAVKMLDERGAFQLRKAVEDVADALGVSRFTVYNYLNVEPG